MVSTDARPGERADDARGDASVDEQFGATDVGGLVGQQEQDRGGDVLGCPQASQRDAAGPLPPDVAVGIDRLGHAGIDQPGGDRVAADLIGTPFQRHLPGEQCDAGLGRAVGAGVGTGGDPVHGCHGDQRSSGPCGDHASGDGAGRDEGAGQVDIDDGPPILDGDRGQRTEPHDARVGDQPVGRRPAGDVGEPVERSIDLGLDRRVGGERDGPVSDLGGGAFGRALVPIEHPDAPVGARGCPCDGGAEALAGPGDDDASSHRRATSEVSSSWPTGRSSRRAADRARARGGRGPPHGPGI